MADTTASASAPAFIMEAAFEELIFPMATSGLSVSDLIFDKPSNPHSVTVSFLVSVLNMGLILGNLTILCLYFQVDSDIQ